MAEVKTTTTPPVTKIIEPGKIAVSLHMNEAEAIYVLSVLGCGAQWAVGPSDKAGSVYDALRASLEYVVEDLDEKEGKQSEQHIAYLKATIDPDGEIHTPYVWQQIGAKPINATPPLTYAPPVLKVDPLA